MGWRISVDEALADAVIQSFSDSAERSVERLSRFRQRDWESAYPWLIASGLTLYFLDQLQQLHMEQALPAAMIHRFQSNRADNQRRNEFLMQEFVAINQKFVQGGVRYSNAKGFTLVPGYCPDSALRNQLDIDFLVDPNDLESCRSILLAAGYIQTVEARSAWVFKAGASELVGTDDHYKPRPHRVVELHFARAGSPRQALCEQQLANVVHRVWHGQSVPVFAPEDQFIAQALHILSHLRSPCTRLSWLLEYKHYVTSHEHDWALWESVRTRSHRTPDVSIAIGLATLLSRRFFGGRAPTQLNSWTLDALPVNVKLWADCYGRSACMSRFPGTKLYLFLDAELARGNTNWSETRRRKLIPPRKLPRILTPASNESLSQRLRRGWFRVRFLFFRLRFHLVEDLRYLSEQRHWKRMVQERQRNDAASIAEGHS